MILNELRFVVEQINMRWPAMHEDMTRFALALKCDVCCGTEADRRLFAKRAPKQSQLLERSTSGVDV